MNYDWDLTYILDGMSNFSRRFTISYCPSPGMTTVEHAIPIPVLYDDVLKLYALSGTGASPTHLVNYGGAFGEQFVWAKVDVPNVEK